MNNQQKALNTIKKISKIMCFNCGKKVNKAWMVYDKEVSVYVQKCRECSGNKGFWRKGVIR